jgi:hypothetical protein
LPGSGGIVEDDSTVSPERQAEMSITTNATTDAPRVSIVVGDRNRQSLPDFHDRDLDAEDALQCEYLLARTVRDQGITRRPVRMTVHYGRNHRSTRTYVLE